MKSLILISSIIISGTLSAYGQGNAKDYFHVPPITFEKKAYFLSDAYHPQDIYYKQEYIPKGETADQFNSMVTIDLLTADIAVKDMVAKKVGELEELKKNDPVAKYQLIENSEKGEYILDFLVTQTVGDKVGIVEWNVYRYKAYTYAPGKTGVLLFAYTKRGYGDGITKFFSTLKTDRAEITEHMTAYKLPDIKLSN